MSYNIKIKKSLKRKQVINIDDRVQELINSTNEMAQETFENPSKMRDFLKTLATMYNTSYNNILLLKSQRDNVSFIATKEEYQNINIKLKMTKTT